MTQDGTQDNIHARITVLDSMYSTQMNRRYYALIDMAEKLDALRSKKGDLATAFRDFAKDPTDADILELFNQHFGIGKNGDVKGQAVSLLSKYAYFESGFRFPIYDSIVRDRFPSLWRYCNLGDEVPAMPPNQIQNFIQAINKMILKLGLDQGKSWYDALDKLLWNVGKIMRGNLSLVLSEEQYQEFVDKVNLTQWMESKKNVFEIPEYGSKLLSIVGSDTVLGKLVGLAEELNKQELNFRQK